MEVALLYKLAEVNIYYQHSKGRRAPRDAVWECHKAKSDTQKFKPEYESEDESA